MKDRVLKVNDTGYYKNSTKSEFEDFHYVGCKITKIMEYPNIEIQYSIDDSKEIIHTDGFMDKHDMWQMYKRVFEKFGKIMG